MAIDPGPVDFIAGAAGLTERPLPMRKPGGERPGRGRRLRLAVALGAAVLVGSLPGGTGAGPAGPAEEAFSSPPRPDTAAAREALAAPSYAVHDASGVRQRLLHPTSFRADDVILPDFEEISDVQDRKLRFFSFLKPLVEEENQRLALTRRRLGFIRDHVRFQRPLVPEDSRWLAAVVKEFRVPISDPQDPDFWTILLRRVDTLPVDLVLVQAANESAWGTSRFAREGNNLFGQWCFRPGCGMVPADRPAGAVYEVAAFATIRESVGSYMRNLNTGRVYFDLRRIREKCRREGRQPEAAELARGLTSYSERGMAYVTEIRAMLRHNAPVIAQLGPR